MSTQRAEALLHPAPGVLPTDTRDGDRGAASAGGLLGAALQQPPCRDPCLASPCERISLLFSRPFPSAHNSSGDGPSPPRTPVTQTQGHQRFAPFALALCGSTCTSLPGALKASPRAPVASPLCASARVPKTRTCPHRHDTRTSTSRDQSLLATAQHQNYLWLNVPFSTVTSVPSGLPHSHLPDTFPNLGPARPALPRGGYPPAPTPGLHSSPEGRWGQMLGRLWQLEPSHVTRGRKGTALWETERHLLKKTTCSKTGPWGRSHHPAGGPAVLRRTPQGAEPRGR